MAQSFVRYWIQDPFWGAMDYLTIGSLRLMPVATASNLGARLGALAGRTRFSNLDARLMGNLRRIAPEKSEAEHRDIAARMWPELGRTLVEITMLDRMRSPDHYEIDGRENFTRHVGSDRARIFLFPHLANWELLGVGVQSLGFEVFTIIEQMRNRFQRALIRRARTDVAYTQITPDFAGMRRIHTILARGGNVSFGMDEFIDSNVISPPFGREINALTNIERAVKLAQRYDALLLPAWCERLEGVRFRFHFEPAIEVPKQGDPDAQAAATVATIVGLLESWIRRRPEQWYMLHRMRLREPTAKAE